MKLIISNKSKVKPIILLLIFFGFWGITFSSTSKISTSDIIGYRHLFVTFNQDYENTLKIVHDDTQNISLDRSVFIDVYSLDGTFLATGSIGLISDNGGIEFCMLDNEYSWLDINSQPVELNDFNIGKIDIRSKTQLEAVVLYKQTNLAASVKAEHYGMSEKTVQHIAEQMDQWNSTVMITKTDETFSDIYMVLKNSNQKNQLNGNDNKTSNLYNGNISELIDMNRYLNNSTEGSSKNWAQLLSQNEVTSPFGLVITKFDNIIASTLFKANDRPRAGAVSSILPCYDWWLGHIVSDDYWWTGVVINNNNEENATIRFICYNLQGQELGKVEKILSGYEKLVGTAVSLGFFQETAYVKVESDKKINVAELFGGEVELGDILVGVDAIPDDNILTINEKNGEPYNERFSGVFPMIKSTDSNNDGLQEWTGLAILNEGDVSRDYALQLFDKEGHDLLGRKLEVTVTSKTKYVKTIAEILSLNGLSDFREQIDHIKIFSKKENSDSLNSPIKAYAVLGDVKENSHNRAWGENLANTSDITAVVQIFNITKGKFADSLDGEENDLYNIYFKLESRVGLIKAASLVLYDLNDNEIETVYSTGLNDINVMKPFAVVDKAAVLFEAIANEENFKVKLKVTVVEKEIENNYLIETNYKFKIKPAENKRADGAVKVETELTGSIQNPAWSPDDSLLLFTRFRSAYNEGISDLFVFNFNDSTLKTLVSDGSSNVNLPGTVWNPVTHKITFSSDREPHDEIYTISENGSTGDEVRITNRTGYVAYEPSFSPDGQYVVFESHVEDVEENGVIVKYKIDETESYQYLTDANDDCRQPNWSPSGNLILYQKFSNGQWDIWVMNTDGTNARKVTEGNGSKTDAVFSPDGQQIVYSSDNGELEFANLYIIPTSGGTPVRVTNFQGYDGAPAWSNDGTKIVFESYQGDPDDSAGTTLWVIAVPSN